MSEEPDKKEKPSFPHPMKIIANYPYKKEPNKKGILTEYGTFHVRIFDLGIEIRGLRYTMDARKYIFIRLPSFMGKIDGRECTYPLFSFMEGTKQRAFIDVLRHCFDGFRKSSDYVSFEEMTTGKKLKPVKRMVFRDVTPLAKPVRKPVPSKSFNNGFKKY